MFVFDTDILSHVLMPARYSTLLARMAAVPRDRQYTTTITVAEMIFGAHRSSRRDYLLRQFQDRLWPNLGILRFDFAAAEAYGQLRAQLERDGTPLAVPDLSRDVTGVTGNIRHFGRVPGLGVENWM